MNKKLLFAAIGAGAISVSLLAPAASADPVGAPTYRYLPGGGSDTTEEVMQAMAEVITYDRDGAGGNPAELILGNYNALGPAFDSRDPATLPAGKSCNYLEATATSGNGPGKRPNGSSAGRDRLVEASQAGNAREGCLDWARSSSGPPSTALPVQLTYIPFGVEAFSYAVRSDSTISRTLSVAQLKSVYQSNQPNCPIIPLLPQTGSGTRPAWIAALGITEATKGTCVRDTWVNPSNGLTENIQEHDGRPLLAKNELVPYSVAQFSAQQAGVITDKRGRSVIAAPGGLPAQGTNPAATITRKLYNLIPTSKVGNPSFPELNAVFVGSGSSVCQQGAIINKLGISQIADCGSTSLTSTP